MLGRRGRDAYHALYVNIRRHCLGAGLLDSETNYVLAG